MNSAQTPPNENEPYDANLDAQDEELAGGGGGGNRLALIAGALLLLLGLGYWLVPKGQGEGLAGATPSFMLPDAAVSGATPAAPLDSATTTVAQAVAVPDPANPAAATAAPQTVATPAAAAQAAAPASPDPVAPAAAPEPAAAPAPEAPAPAVAANQTLTGRITDENGKPLVGATVFLRGAGRGTSTDADGNYSMEVPAGDNKLVFGYGGYVDEEVESRGGKAVNVALTPDAKGKKKRR